MTKFDIRDSAGNKVGELTDGSDGAAQGIGCLVVLTSIIIAFFVGTLWAFYGFLAAVIFAVEHPIITVGGGALLISLIYIVDKYFYSMREYAECKLKPIYEHVNTYYGLYGIVTIALAIFLIFWFTS